MVLAAETPQRNLAVIDFTLSDHEHRRDLCQAVLAHLVVNLLVAGVHLGADAGGVQRVANLDRIGVRIRRDRRHDGLHGRHPHRHAPGIVLDQDADKAFERSQDRAVQHDGAVFLAVLADIRRVQPFGQHEIHLQGAALPVAADGVAQHEFELGAVKRAFARVQRIVQPRRLDRFGQCCFGTVPYGVLAGAGFGPVGKLDDDFFEAAILVNAEQQFTECFGLRRDLVLGAEDMCIVLRKRPHPHQPVQCARWLIPMARPEFGHAQRQLAIAGHALAEYLDVAGAVHRLQREDAVVFRLGREHVVAEFFPVTGCFPQAAINQLWCFYLDIVRLIQPRADIGLKRAVQRPSIGMPEYAADGFFLEMEQAHLAAEAAVVTLFRFLQHHQMRFELFFVAPGCAVDALQHLVIGIAAPIGAGQFQQLEAFTHMAGRRQMRPTTQVHPVALAIHRDRLSCRQIVNKLGFVFLTDIGEMPDSVVTVPFLAAKDIVALDDFHHLGFDLFQIVRRKRLFAGEIVIEPVFNRRPYRHLGAGIQCLYGFGHDMGGIVPDQIKCIFGFACDDFDRAVRVDAAGQIQHFAVNFNRERGFCQARPDCRRQLRAGYGAVELFHTAIGQRNRHIAHDIFIALTG